MKSAAAVTLVVPWLKSIFVFRGDLATFFGTSVVVSAGTKRADLIEEAELFVGRRRPILEHQEKDQDLDFDVKSSQT